MPSVNHIAFAFMLLCAGLCAAARPALASFAQLGPKLIGSGAVGANVQQGVSVAMSADGNTAIVGGLGDSSFAGAAWVFTRSGGVWSQQGNKLVGSGAVGNAQQGSSVALSADGNTAIVGGNADNSFAGAAWVFTRSGGVWTQQGNKLVGGAAVGNAQQGRSVALSADGNTAVVGGQRDDSSAGAAWVFTRSGAVWSQQGNKLVGSGAVNPASQGTSVALSADGNTVIVGGRSDSSLAGAVWVFTRSGGTWSQQGNKLVGSGAVGIAQQGFSVALSADGNTFIAGGMSDNSVAGAAWVFTRSGAEWSQQGNKLVGSGAVGANVGQGISVALSADGNTAIVGAFGDNSGAGAAWVFTRSGVVWTQQGNKLVGSGAVGAAGQGFSVALSGDGFNVITGGFSDDGNAGAVWIFAQPAFAVTPAEDIEATGNVGGPFLPPSFTYTLTANDFAINYTVTGVPSWLTASTTSGVVGALSSETLIFTVNADATTLAAGTHGPDVIAVTNTTNGIGNRSIVATLTIGDAGPASIVSSVLPASRSVQVGTPATAFAAIINTGSTIVTNCGLGFGGSSPAGFTFQTTDPTTNAVAGALNAPANIAAGGVQTYVFSVTPFVAFDPRDVPILAGCSNTGPAPTVVGLNTLLLSASDVPVPDVVALAATATNDGIVTLPGANGAAAFAVATVNVGIGASITASADTGAVTQPITIMLCQTDPATGVCTSAIGASVTTDIGANATPTFAIFVQGSGNVLFDPARNRIFVRFKGAGDVTRGATSVAVRTQ